VAAGSKGKAVLTECTTPQHITDVVNVRSLHDLVLHLKSLTLSKRMGRLQGKVALITGAGSGFGEGTAKAFAKEGADVIVADIAVEGGKRVEAEIEAAKVEGAGTAIFLEFDCTKREAWEAGLRLAKDKFGKLDIVCNNAGTVNKGDLSVD
jgi:3-oxoacyl-[acyl-carrier protein] reductase